MNPYFPSNGTEGMIFMNEFCYKCYKYNSCTILNRSLTGTRPKQWVYKENKPTCTSFNRVKPKSKSKNKRQTGMNLLFNE